MIDARKAQVFKRGLAQKLKEAPVGGLRRKGTRADVGDLSCGRAVLLSIVQIDELIFL
jgi:hypothetical protein